LAPVRVKDLWGFIDPRGGVVIKLSFAEASGFVSGLALVKFQTKVFD
jgi:hypothetical protein